MPEASPAPARWIAPVPNLLTALRLGMAVAFPFAPERWHVALVAAAGASDVLDGVIARRFHATSEVGRLLDGIADKAFAFSAIATFVLSGLVPWWAGLLAMARDVVVAAIAGWCAARRAWGAFREMRPRFLGKVATGAAFLWFLTLLVAALEAARWPTWALAAATSVGAAADYAARFLASGRPARRE